VPIEDGGIGEGGLTPVAESPKRTPDDLIIEGGSAKETEEFGHASVGFIPSTGLTKGGAIGDHADLDLRGEGLASREGGQDGDIAWSGVSEASVDPQGDVHDPWRVTDMPGDVKLGGLFDLNRFGPGRLV